MACFSGKSFLHLFCQISPTMNNYKVHSREIIKPTLSMIRVFIADDQYKSNPVGDVTHMPQSLCWVAQINDLKAKIAAATDLAVLINETVKEFDSVNTHTIVMLYQLYEHQPTLVDKLRAMVYLFINDTYLRIAD